MTSLKVIWGAFSLCKFTTLGQTPFLRPSPAAAVAASALCNITRVLRLQLWLLRESYSVSSAEGRLLLLNNCIELSVWQMAAEDPHLLGSPLPSSTTTECPKNLEGWPSNNHSTLSNFPPPRCFTLPSKPSLNVRTHPAVSSTLLRDGCLGLTDTHGELTGQVQWDICG